MCFRFFTYDFLENYIVIMSGMRCYLQAAATTCYVATHPRLLNVSGKFFSDCNETSSAKLGSNLDEAARLWSASEIMVSGDPKAVFDPLNPLA
jgi:hypothetical protein